MWFKRATCKIFHFLVPSERSVYLVLVEDGVELVSVELCAKCENIRSLVVDDTLWDKIGSISHSLGP